ncbi:MAG: ATP-grasp domain-containing protein [bacterium]|nr:ATP-grasp domain-containing protein [bacterium]
MARTIVGVLRGGTSSEYNLSLKTGAAMLAALPDDRFDTRDIFIDKRGYWHVRGVPVDPIRALAQTDVVLNALHGGVGEDGTVQRILEQAGVPYSGSRPLASGISLNKIIAREILRNAGVCIPRGMWFTLDDTFTTGEMARGVFAVLGPPYIVKPPSEGASMGIRIAQSLNDLPDAIGDVLDAFGAALVEEYIRGEEATVGVIEHFRNEDFYALPPVHVILPEDSRIYESHYHEQALARHSVPSDFSQNEKNILADMARAAHRALELSHFSRADFIVTPRAIYLLEVNAIPGLYPGAAFPHMLESVGSSVPEFLEHSINLARA